MRKGAFLFLAAWALPVGLFAQNTAFEPDLSTLTERQGLHVTNRNVSHFNEGTKRVLHLDDAVGRGVAWFDNVQFSEGTVEFDARSRNISESGFLGLAFHGVDDTTYEVLYFRPSNFLGDAAARAHSVQYSAYPSFTWNKLRGSTARYEAEIYPAPKPDEWFHVRLVFSAPTLRVYVDAQREPALTFNELGTNHAGRIGLWVGNGSGGDFANFKITSPAAGTN